jgi:hypothetical protein
MLLRDILIPRDINTPKPPPGENDVQKVVKDEADQVADQRQVQSAIRQLSENSRLEEVYQDFLGRAIISKRDSPLTNGRHGGSAFRIGQNRYLTLLQSS